MIMPKSNAEQCIQHLQNSQSYQSEDGDEAYRGYEAMMNMVRVFQGTPMEAFFSEAAAICEDIASYIEENPPE